MADDMTPEQRRKNMQHIRSKDTSIEVKLRKALWNEGIRYRKNYKELTGKPDIVITKSVTAHSGMEGILKRKNPWKQIMNTGTQRSDAIWRVMTR